MIMFMTLIISFVGFISLIVLIIRVKIRILFLMLSIIIFFYIKYLFIFIYIFLIILIDMRFSWIGIIKLIHAILLTISFCISCNTFCTVRPYLKPGLALIMTTCL